MARPSSLAESVEIFESARLRHILGEESGLIVSTTKAGEEEKRCGDNDRIRIDLLGNEELRAAHEIRCEYFVLFSASRVFECHDLALDVIIVRECHIRPVERPIRNALAIVVALIDVQLREIRLLLRDKEDVGKESEDTTDEGHKRWGNQVIRHPRTKRSEDPEIRPRIDIFDWIPDRVGNGGDIYLPLSFQFHHLSFSDSWNSLGVFA